jgi:predicted nucleic acid-binding protein
VSRGGRLVAVYDANVLYPAPIRDLLVRLARAGLVAARWTDQIHHEWIRSVLRNRPDLSPANLQRTRELMDRAVPGALVEGFDRRIPLLHLPDPDDRHVLAAAIQTRADVIVTFNLADFPAASCAPHGIEAIHPDAFVLGLIGQNAAAVLAVMREHRSNLKKPPMTVDEYLDNFARVGLVKSAETMRSRGTEL